MKVSVLSFVVRDGVSCVREAMQESFPGPEVREALVSYIAREFPRAAEVECEEIEPSTCEPGFVLVRCWADDEAQFWLLLDDVEKDVRFLTGFDLVRDRIGSPALKQLLVDGRKGVDFLLVVPGTEPAGFQEPAW